MTFVGKILVVMHLLFSVLFMAFAGAVFTAQKNWRADSEAKATQLAKAQADLRDASTQLQDLQNQKAAAEARTAGTTPPRDVRSYEAASRSREAPAERSRHTISRGGPPQQFTRSQFHLDAFDPSQDSCGVETRAGRALDSLEDYSGIHRSRLSSPGFYLLPDRP